MSNTASAVVIGGGIVGSSIAHYLAEKGLKDVVLLERDSIAGGATGVSDESLCRNREYVPGRNVLANRTLPAWSPASRLMAPEGVFR